MRANTIKSDGRAVGAGRLPSVPVRRWPMTRRVGAVRSSRFTFAAPRPAAVHSGTGSSSPVPTENETYYWGGSVCPGKHLSYSGNSDAMVDALAEYATFPDMCITPYYKNGQGGYRCLVTFTAAIRTGDSCDTRPQ